MTQSSDKMPPHAGRVSRRIVLGGMVAAPMVLKGFSPARAQSLRILKMAAQNPFQTTDYPAFVADRFGMFAKQGLKAEFTSAANAMLPLLAGDIDVTTVGSLNGLLPIGKKQDFQFIATVIEKISFALIVKPDSPIAAHAHKWPDVWTALKGKQVGVTISGGLVDMVARYLSAKAGLTPDKDITITPAGDAVVLLGNVEKGVFDAAVQVSPLFERAIERKTAVSVLDIYKGEGPQPQINLIGGGSPGTRKSFADKNPDVINAYLRAMQDSLDFINKKENQPAIVDALAKELKVEAASLKSPMETFFTIVAKKVSFSRAQWDTSVEVMKINGALTDTPSYEDGVFAGSRA